MSEREKLLAMVKKNINIGGVVSDILDEVLEPALQKVVDDSANPFDNMLMATVYPLIEKELKELVEKQVNKMFHVE